MSLRYRDNRLNNFIDNVMDFVKIKSSIMVENKSPLYTNETENILVISPEGLKIPTRSSTQWEYHKALFRQMESLVDIPQEGITRHAYVVVDSSEASLMTGFILQTLKIFYSFELTIVYSSDEVSEYYGVTNATEFNMFNAIRQESHVLRYDTFATSVLKDYKFKKIISHYYGESNPKSVTKVSGFTGQLEHDGLRIDDLYYMKGGVHDEALRFDTTPG
jgi:hypothetical protein